MNDHLPTILQNSLNPKPSAQEKLYDRFKDLKPQERVQQLIKNPQGLRNIMIIAHVDHGKTTLSDSLVAQAGLLNEALVGQQLLLDKEGLEKARGITITTGCISLPFQKNGKGYLVNLRDTPGHVDFTYELNKTIRAVEGAILLVDAKEGVKTQTQAVVGMAVKEGLPIILVINKVDRLIKELNSSPTQVYASLCKVLDEVNALMVKFTGDADPYFHMEKNVLWGSGLDRWVLSTSILREKGIKFSNLTSRIVSRDYSLSRDFNVAQNILEMVIRIIPSPQEVIGERLKSYFDNDLPQDFRTGDPKGNFRAFVCDSHHSRLNGSTKVIRVISGTLSRGDKVYISDEGYSKPYRVNKIMVDMTRSRVEVSSAPAGSIVMITGVPVQIGSTISSLQNDTIVIPTIKNTKEPVVSVALKSKSSDTPALLEVLREICNHDKTLRVEERQSQIVLNGVGQLQIEVALHQIVNEYGIRVEPEKPIVSYSETIEDGPPVESIKVRSPNGLTDFKLAVSRLPPQIEALLRSTTIEKKKLTSVLQANGYPSELAKKCEGVINGDSLYLNDTKGAEFMKDCKEEIIGALSHAITRGPILGKNLRGLQLRITYADIHQDPKKRSELQFSRCFEEALEDIFVHRKSVLLEPVMSLELSIPVDPTRYLTGVMNHLDNHRGVLEDTLEGGIPGYLLVKYTIPLQETFGLNKKLMSLCEGRVNLVMALKQYSKVPEAIACKLSSEAKKNRTTKL